MKHFLSFYDSISHRSIYFLHILLFGILFTATSILKAQTGKALHFDGTNDFVMLPIELKGDYTKEAWINASATTGFPNILSGTGTALFISNGQLVAGHATGGFAQVLDAVAISTGTWYHVAVTYNAASGTMKLYKDGVLVSSTPAVPNYIEPFLDLSLFSGANHFSGFIDEVRIWKIERSISQLVSNKDCELTGDEPGLLVYYNFNQGIAGSANSGQTSLLDIVDHCVGINGSLNNFELNENSSNWVAASPIFTGSCSNSFANINLSGNGLCISSGDNSPSLTDNTNFGNLGVKHVTRKFFIKNTGSAVLNIGAATISGADAANFSVTGLPAAILNSGDSTSFEISFAPGGALGIKVASVTVNNDDEDESLFSFAITGNLAGQGMALSFDGFNDRIDIPLAFSGSYTKEAWINTQSLTAFPNIISGNSSTGTAVFLANGRLAAGHGPAFNQLQDATALVAGTWYHVAVTFDAATREMKLYKDAVLVASAIDVPGYNETYQQLGSFSGANFFNGNLDEVRIWNLAKTPAELLAMKNCELSGLEPGLLAYYNFNTGVVGSDNTNFNTLNDVHGTCPINGTLVNFTLNGTVSNWVTPGGDLTGSCTVQVSNISTSGNSICIATGDFSPSATDFTDFGLIATNTNLDRTFVITNNGGATLNISDITIAGSDAGSFSIQNTGDAFILPGFSTSFIVRFSPANTGVKNATVTIVNNDGDELLYTFAIKGEAFGTVPVSLIYFRAESANKTGLLSWATAQENKSIGFEIHRSQAATAGWETIGFVGSFNLATGSRYNFTDLAPMKGNNAYRLKQVDIDGNLNFSQIEILNFKGDMSSINIYPNPVKHVMKLVYNDSKLFNSYATIRTTSGANVKKVLLNNFQQTIDVSNLTKGIYFINFSNGKVLRIIKN